MGLLWDHSPLSTEAWRKGQQRGEGLGDNPSSSPGAAAVTGRVLSFLGPPLLLDSYGSLTPWSGLLLVLGIGVAV